MRNFFRRIFTRSAIFTLLIAFFASIVLGAAVYTWNAKNITGDQLPMPLGFGAAVVLSGSMESELSKNDLIFVKRTNELSVDKIVVYQSGRSLTVHRIVEINGDEIITKGDANNTADPPITSDMIKGEVVLVIPFLGLIINLVQNPIIVFFILALAIYLMERSFRKEKGKKLDELEEIKNEIRKLTDELKK